MDYSEMRAEQARLIPLLGVFLLTQLLLSLAGVVPVPYAELGESHLFPRYGFAAFYAFVLLVFSAVLPSRLFLLTVAAGLALAGAYLAFAGPPPEGTSLFTHYLFSVLAGLGCSALLTLVLVWRMAPPAQEASLRVLLGFILYFLLFMPLPYASLRLTSLLHPATLDAVAFHFDASLGFQPSVILGLWRESFPAFRYAITFAYDAMPLGFAVLYALSVRYPRRINISLLWFWAISALFASIAYHLAPVAGPAHLFGKAFPLSVPPAEAVTTLGIVLQPVARNGVPSMHFGWAFGFWLISQFFEIRWIRNLFAVLLGLNILATLGLGEHYLVDLVVSIPLILAILGFSMRGGDAASRRPVIVAGAVLALLWMLFLRFGIDIVLAAPWLVPVAELATVAVGVAMFRRLKASLRVPGVLETAQAAQGMIHSREVLTVVAVFVFSGFAGLVYEVVYAKALALAFGSTALATYTVLATYMCGLALGAWAGGWLAERTRRPLVGFALCELGIGLYSVLTPLIFPAMRNVYAALAGGFAPDAPGLTVLRFSLGAAVLLPPTLLMGMTLPLLARYLGDRRETLGVSVALLYGANTLGAALGALLAGYLLLPAFGVLKSTLLAAALNFSVAYAGLRLARGRLDAAAAGPTGHGSESATLESHQSIGWLAIVILAIGGVLTLILEIDYIHLLAVVAGNSAYAFSLMLSTFLAGLSIGAMLARRLLATKWSLAVLLAWLETGFAIVLLAGVFSWNHIPSYFSDFAGYPGATRFPSREFVRATVCALVMLPPSIFIGMLYPVAFEAVGRAFPSRRMTMLGRAMALNTAGNIAGVLLGGFVLLPLLGALRSIQLSAIVALALALLTTYWAAGRRKLALLPLPAAALLLIPQPSTLDYSLLSTGANVYFMAQGFGRAIDHAESIDGGLTTVVLREEAGGKPIKTLLTNGKFQGNDAEGGEVIAQAGFALAPLLHVGKRDRALVIGYGTGMSARTLHDASFARMDIVELSGDIVRMADRHFEGINKRVAQAPGVATYITDGRNYLLLQERQYDLISMEISSIWFAGAASLYNREFYQLAKARLADGGVLQQWVQLHHMRSEDFLTIIATIRSEFRYVWLYLIGGQGILVASNDVAAVPSAQHARKLEEAAGLKHLRPLFPKGFSVLAEDDLLDPAATDALIAKAAVPLHYLVSSDDNLRLEYGTPKGNVLDGQESMASIIEMTRKARAAAGER